MIEEQENYFVSPVKARTDTLNAGWSGFKTTEQTDKETLMVSTPRPQKNKKRQTRKRKTQKVDAEANAVFDPTCWFKSYYDNFFTKEQQLKKLTEMEDPSVIAGG